MYEYLQGQYTHTLSIVDTQMSGYPARDGAPAVEYELRARVHFIVETASRQLDLLYQGGDYEFPDY